MSPGGGACGPDGGAVERGGQFVGFGRVAADDLDGVAASERLVGQGAGHVPQADDADAGHENILSVDDQKVDSSTVGRNW